MRKIIFFVFLNTAWADAFYLHLGGCGAYKFREDCSENVCSGYMESKETYEKNDKRLAWDRCNESIIIQMRDMFPGLNFENNIPNKCEPTCLTFDLSKCSPNIKRDGPSRHMDKCTKKSTTSISDLVQQLLEQLTTTTKTTPVATSTVATTQTTLVVTTTVTTTTTTTTRNMADKEIVYQGES